MMRGSLFYFIRLYLYILFQVTDRSCINKMTASNLAVVFGPNLSWSKDQSLSLVNIIPINHFTEYLLINHEDIIFHK